jgi:hypothetical protein
MAKVLEGAIEVDEHLRVYTSTKCIPEVLSALRILARVGPHIMEMEAEKAQAQVK